MPSLWPYRLVPQEAHYSVADEQNMTLLGFLTFADPPKPDAAQVLQALKNDGVQVKILTGDYFMVLPLALVPEMFYDSIEVERESSSGGGDPPCVEGMDSEIHSCCGAR